MNDRNIGMGLAGGWIILTSLTHAEDAARRALALQAQRQVRLRTQRMRRRGVQGLACVGVAAGGLVIVAVAASERRQRRDQLRVASVDNATDSPNLSPDPAPNAVSVVVSTVESSVIDLREPTSVNVH